MQRRARRSKIADVIPRHAVVPGPAQPRNLFGNKELKAEQPQTSSRPRENSIVYSCIMEFRRLGHSGLKVPVLCFGAATFGGEGEFFRAWGATDVAEATRLVDICLEAGVNLFDTADVYSQGRSEEILGQAIAGRRDKVLDLDQSHLPHG